MYNELFFCVLYNYMLLVSLVDTGTWRVTSQIRSYAVLVELNQRRYNLSSICEEPNLKSRHTSLLTSTASSLSNLNLRHHIIHTWNTPYPSCPEYPCPIYVVHFLLFLCSACGLCVFDTDLLAEHCTAELCTSSQLIKP